MRRTWAWYPTSHVTMLTALQVYVRCTVRRTLSSVVRMYATSTGRVIAARAKSRVAFKRCSQESVALIVYKYQWGQVEHGYDHLVSFGRPWSVLTVAHLLLIPSLAPGYIDRTTQLVVRLVCFH